MVAYLALFVALSGTSYAAVTLSRNDVRSKHIKNGHVKKRDLARNVVTSGKVRNGSLKAKDFKSGHLPAGPTGPAGPAGPKGDTGSPGLSDLERVQATSPLNSDSPKSQTATCPDGKTMVAGGHQIIHQAGDVVVDESVPLSDVAWYVEAWEVASTTATWRLRAWGVCAVVG